MFYLISEFFVTFIYVMKHSKRFDYLLYFCHQAAVSFNLILLVYSEFKLYIEFKKKKPCGSLTEIDLRSIV